MKPMNLIPDQPLCESAEAAMQQGWELYKSGFSAEAEEYFRRVHLAEDIRAYATLNPASRYMQLVCRDRHPDEALKRVLADNSSRCPWSCLFLAETTTEEERRHWARRALETEQDSIPHRECIRILGGASKAAQEVRYFPLRSSGENRETTLQVLRTESAEPAGRDRTALPGLLFPVLLPLAAIGFTLLSGRFSLAAICTAALALAAFLTFREKSE